MKKFLLPLILIFGTSSLLQPIKAAEPATPAGKPNIIFILADDLGIGNVSIYGADKFSTPNIDALAKSGIRFEHCYASPLCGPSRALVMTGRYAYHTGMTSNVTGNLLTPAREVMIPKVLKSAGYVTGMCGKWAQLPLQPSDWGFDEYLRFNGSGKYWNTQPKNKRYMLNGIPTPLRDGEYLPDRMHEFVVDFITRHKDQPFYLYYAMSHVHQPILRTPDSAPGMNGQFRLYQDNVAYMDKLVGRLIAKLDQLNLRNNTLIIFAGDNGTAQPFYLQSTVHGKILSGCKATMLECGALVPNLASWPGAIQPGQDTQSLINICDYFPTLAAIAGAKIPPKLTVDGQGFAPELLGKSTVWPRDWIFVELGRRWYDRDSRWKLNELSALFDMRGAPFSEPQVPPTTQDPAAIAARKRLQAVLDELNPAAGYLDPRPGQRPIPGAPAPMGNKTPANPADPALSGNANEEDQ